MAMSPASSPRLPSPPPMAEDQIGPKSPLAGLMDDIGKLEAPEMFTQGASRRIRPGTKAADMPEGPPLVDLTEVYTPVIWSFKRLCIAKRSQIDTAFQLTEHLKALHSAAIHPDGSDKIIPIDRATAIRLAQPPEGVDRALWLYELCRFLCLKINLIIVALFADEPPCSSQTCPEMRASEWQYLCAVHDPPKPCCAIDYCCHTLDWAANILTSPKHFPSRLSLNAEVSQGHQPLRQLTNIFRRVYRIFAHAWFQHRELFWRVENKTGLYILFKTVCDMYGLIPEENYTVPPEAEGLEPVTQDMQVETGTTILQKSQEEPVQEEEHREGGLVGDVNIASGHTTKRHRHTVSTDTASIATVIEENEDEEKGEVVEEDSTELETPVAPQQGEHSAFASAVEGHPETPEEKDPEEVEAVLSNLTLAEPVEEPEIAAKEEAEEEEESPSKPTEEHMKEDPENEVAETTEITQDAPESDKPHESEKRHDSEKPQSEEPEEITKTEDNVKDTEESAKDTGD